MSRVFVGDKRLSVKTPLIVSGFCQGICPRSLEIEIGFVGENCALGSSVAMVGVACVHSSLLDAIVTSGSEDIGVV